MKEPIEYEPEPEVVESLSEMCPYCKASATDDKETLLNLSMYIVRYECGTIGYKVSGRYNKQCGRS